MELPWGDRGVCQEELISTVLMLNIIQKKNPNKLQAFTEWKLSETKILKTHVQTKEQKKLAVASALHPITLTSKAGW